MFRATFYFTKLTGLFFVQSAGILLSANVVGKDKSALGVERLVRLRLCGTKLLALRVPWQAWWSPAWRSGLATQGQEQRRSLRNNPSLKATRQTCYLSARSNVFSAENACCSSASSNALASNAISKVIIFNPEAK